MARVEKLHYITQGASHEEVIKEVKDVICGGCRWIQLRMKNSSQEQIIDVANIIMPICKAAEAVLLINDSVEVCIASNADGVHLGKSDMPLAEARTILGADKIIGRTCNTIDDVVSLNGTSVDYIGAGPLRFTSTKKVLSPTLGFDGYRGLVASTKVQIIAIGGIVTDDIHELLQLGVYGVAVSATIYNAEDRVATTAHFIELLKK